MMLHRLLRFPKTVNISYHSLRGQLRFYTQEECGKWLAERKRQNPDLTPGIHVERVDYPPEPHRIFYVAHWMAAALAYRRPVLLHITEWGIWSSNENWHLYYKLRQSYGDKRLLQETPGHLFLEHETEDLASFLQLSMLNGWGGYFLTDANYVNAFFSHDEFIDFFAERDDNLADVRKEFGTKQATVDNK
jgi:hypothetical protein